MAILLTNSVAASGLDVTIEMLKHNHSSLDAIESGIRLVESDPEAGWVGYGGIQIFWVWLNLTPELWTVLISMPAQ